MHPVDARDLALRLIRDFHLRGWRFRFDHARRRFGSCRYGQKLITLSRPLTLLNDEAEVRDTLLHEIAHALTPGDGHGAKWKAACVRIGAKPQRCYSENSVVAPPRRPPRYRLGCNACGWWVDRRRRTASLYLCRTCNRVLVYEERHGVALAARTAHKVAR